MKVTRKEHPVWKDWLMMKQYSPEILTVHRNTPIIGQWQYIYSSDKGEISLVELPNYFLDGVDWWETYSLTGELFDDVERFGSKEEAEVRIRELLD